MMQSPVSVFPRLFTALQRGCAGLVLWSSCLLMLMSGVASAQENLSAFVDRTDVSVNDVLTLTIRVGATLGASRPSLDGLEDDFELLGTTTSSSFSNINGNVQSWTEYRVSLKPRNTGNLTIPAFRVAGEATRPITVNVSESTPVSGASNDDIFLSTSVSKNSVYVQEQLVFTVKLYYSVRFNQGAQLSTPQVENSVVQQLGSDQNYQEIVEGIRYDVTERRYVIFPQSSGDLVIPPVYFSATVGGRNGLNRLLNRSSPTRQVNLAGDTHQVTVRPIPESFTGNTWLPAADLNLQEDWSGDSDQIEVGESLTRELRLFAEGLSSSLLPEMDAPEVDGIRFYPDQPQREDNADRNGVTGSRIESAAIVPARVGTFTLPEIRIPWWNTTTDQQEIARVPARTINVTGVAPVPADLPSGPQSSRPVAPAQEVTQQPAESTSVSIAWIITTTLLALGLLFMTFLWLRARNNTQTVMAGPVPVTMTDDTQPRLPDLDKAFKYFVKACEKGTPEEIRRAVLNWGQAYYGNRNIRTLEQLKAHTRQPTIDALLYSLEETLYRPGGEQNGQFRSSQLLKEITAVHKQRKKQLERGQSDELPPLYRN